MSLFEEKVFNDEWFCSFVFGNEVVHVVKSPQMEDKVSTSSQICKKEVSLVFLHYGFFLVLQDGVLFVFVEKDD